MYFRVTTLKKYRITYAPTLKIAQELVDPYDEWNSDNVKGNYYYARNYDRDFTKTVEVDALTKETAKAMFAVKLYAEVMTIGVKGGVEPYIIDGIRNIKSIEEISSDD